MNPAILSEIMSLPASEKLDLIDRLWASIAPEAEVGEVSEEEKRLLDDRWEKYRSKPDSALTVEEFEALLAKRHK